MSCYQPSTVTTVTDPLDSDNTCPGCSATHGVQPQPAPPTVAAWTCTAGDLHWATTVVNPTVRAALSIAGLLPTPQQRSAALLDGTPGYPNLVVCRTDDSKIVLESHEVGAYVITFDEAAANQFFDALGEWLG